MPGTPPVKIPRKLPPRPWMLAIAAGVVALSFLVALKAMDWLSPAGTVPEAALTELPPLPPVARSSYVVASVVVALSAIRDGADRAAPRNFAGKANNPISQLLQNADIGWTAARGPVAVSGGQDAFSLSTPLSGKLNQVAQCQRRDQGRCRLHGPAEARGQLAPGAQSGRAGESRRHQPFGGGSARQRARPGQADDRQDRRRTT
jgi:hypothetical protein